MQLRQDLVVINRYFRQKRQAYMEAYGLKGVHAWYLTAISQSPGISQDQLAQKLAVDKSNVARQVAFLEENGYLARQASPTDRRVLQLFTTEKADALIEPMKAESETWENQLFGLLQPEQLKQLETLLGRLRKAVEEGEVAP